MAVLDLLPHCVSGVYFMYHSDFEKFGLGKVSALREAALAIEQDYQYYYMGYYIHTCPKMQYKNDYKPQHILDLETMQWHEMDTEIWSMLDTNHYMSPSLLKGITSIPASRRAFKSALEAVTAYEDGGSLFHMHFPGMMSEDELLESVDLDDIRVRIQKDRIVHARVCGPPG
jgi:hypothetical protein